MPQERKGKKKKGMNTNHSARNKNHWIWCTAIKSLHGNCLCKQRLDPEQDKTCKHINPDYPQKK